MGLIPQTKCSRCDRTYSGLRSRCPYCGTRRHKKGKRVSDGDNATWKLIIGVLLIVVLIAAVLVIVVTSLNDKPDETPNDDGNKPGYSQHDNVDNKPGTNPDGNTPSDGNTGDGNTGDGNNGNTGDDGNGNGEGDGDGNGQTPDNTTKVTSVSLKSNYADPFLDMTISVNEKQTLTCIITPSDATTSVPVWTSSDESVFAVVPDGPDGLTATVTGIAVGDEKVTVTVDGVSYTADIRVR